MSGSIKLKHASGNGVIIAAPSSNPASDRTLTLPSDADGVIAKTDASGNLAVTGDLTVDTDTLKVDSSNNRVGIGTTSPSSELHVKGVGEILRLETTATTGSNYINFNDADENKAFIGLGSGLDDSFSISLLKNSSLRFATNSTERMRIDGSGNVGIGTSSPSHKLHTTIGAGESNGVAFLNANSQGLNIYTDTSADNADVYLDQGLATASLYFAQAGTKRMTLDSSGNVLIGTTSADSDGLSIRPRQANNTTRLVFNRANTSDNGTVLQFLNNTNTVGTIRHTDSSTTYNTSSDYRLKENATAISDGITRLKTLKPYRFNFKVDASKTVDGFFAHEVTAVPEAISGEKDAVNEDGSIDPQGIDQSKLVPLLTAALQEEVAKREALEARVAALEAK